ncbi:MAG: hypothetical protein HY301_00680 [Verrucomicrobia bacterium]|nr:hypothetical protein [Verrucomicrobiota bacterium]
MPATSAKQAHEYAERIRARLPRAFQAALEAVPVTKYGLEQKCGVSREMMKCVESGESVPTFHVGARLAHGLGMKLWQFVRNLEDDAES